TITHDEKRRYQLIQEADVEILESVHNMEQVENLSNDKQFLLQFLRTQLEDDWRAPCLEILLEWKKYKHLPPSERWNHMKEVREKWWHPKR
ncbi:hypothetical protein KKC44_01500, partial [Patescibacteria group bacterium]|nr:hypothetical protein [Patescibacteria group bacterium]